jgi:glutamine amidotransferase
MSQLFGCICNQPERVMTALTPVREVLMVPETVTRWGLAYVQAGEVLLSRHPRRVRDEFDFFSALGELKSDYVIGYAATDDHYAGTYNTQPYRFRSWMFAQDCEVENFPAVSGELIESIPSYLRRNIKGKAPSEVLFHMFLALLHDAGQLDDPNLDVRFTREAARDSLALFRSHLEAAGLEFAIGNIVVSNSRSMIAIRNAGPLFVRRLRHLEDPKRPDTEFKSVLVVSAAELPGEGFEELPAGNVLAVSRDVNTDIVPLRATVSNGES